MKEISKRLWNKFGEDEMMDLFTTYTSDDLISQDLDIVY